MYSFANIFEIATDELFAELSIAKLDFFVEGASWGILKDHIGGIFIFFIVVVEKFDDVGVVEFMVHVNFFLGVFVEDLRYIGGLPSW